MLIKKIHYCWFGTRPIPEKEKLCIESWKRYFPDYELVLWNENSFDINSTNFVRQAYSQNAYAFVSDYVRAYALYSFGGIYLDTDFEILNDEFKYIVENNYPLLGFETKSHIGTAMMAFPKGHKLMADFLEYYHNHDYIDKKGRIDNIANVSILSDLLKGYGLKLNGTHQKCGDINIYERKYFFPKRIAVNDFIIEESTCGIHRCSNSWMTESQKIRGNNKIWIKVCRPILTIIRNTLLAIAGKEFARSVEICFRNKLK